MVHINGYIKYIYIYIYIYICVCVCVCVYSCISYLARKSHLFCAVLCCYVWPLRPCHIFPHHVMNGMIFRGKKLLDIIVCFDFIYNLRVCPSFCLTSWNSIQNFVIKSCRGNLKLVNISLAKPYLTEGRKWISIRTFHSYGTFWLNSVEEKLVALKFILYLLLHIKIR